MTRIGIISDTHHFLDEAVFEHFKNCDEIWHGGDFGTADISDKLSAFKNLEVFMEILMAETSAVFTRSNWCLPARL